MGRKRETDRRQQFADYADRWKTRVARGEVLPPPSAVPLKRLTSKRVPLHPTVHPRRPDTQWSLAILDLLEDVRDAEHRFWMSQIDYDLGPDFEYVQ